MQISDALAIRALAHPLRLDLLELLSTIGPATAARCGRALGVPQANCSFHLRQLAKYGFVEDAGPGRDRRERQWQVPERRPTIRIAGNPVVQRELERVVIQRETRAILDFAEREDEQSAQWRVKAGMVTALAVLSAEEAAELRAQWQALLAPYVARTQADGVEGVEGDDPQTGQRAVRYFMAATPLPDFTSGGNSNESDH
ncbi:winged helix-turn-helix domain-containing protein [Kitasatospora azatica]|uniref:winged helix-turn-helix domain-containing protein n=1 Tax=Kitasatospora azatica TaxID=58347 RepID=UPI00068D1651|nr:helix-turn-helix domain-containing protein [Kitasatospora azatica]